MARICSVCGVDSARHTSRVCRYCALQRAGPHEIYEEEDARAEARSAARWQLAGDVLLWLVPPAFVVLIVVADLLVHR
jgi:hypothetical protein